MNSSVAKSGRKFFHRFHEDESGAGYTLSYVMTIPLYLVMVIGFIELSSALHAKIGTIYAAYAAARTASVWESIDPSASQEKADQAAVQAMTPFAGGLAGLRLKSGKESGSGEALLDFYEANKGGGQASIRYVGAKFKYASVGTHVSIKTDPTGPNTWNEDLVVTVDYDYPFIFPLFGRLLMESERDGVYIQVISTTVRLQNETPANEEQQLGIYYVP